MIVGQTACMSAAYTPLNCGEVLSKQGSPSYVPGSFNFIIADFCGRDGDSGAGAFNGSMALGLDSGGYDDNCGPGHREIFGHIEYAQAFLGSTVATSETQPAFISVEDARNGNPTFTVRLNKPVVCDIPSYYWEVKSTNLLGVPVGHTVTDRECSYDSDSTLRLTVTPPPVLLTTLEVTLWRGELDVGGWRADPATQRAPVLL